MDPNGDLLVLMCFFQVYVITSTLEIKLDVKSQT